MNEPDDEDIFGTALTPICRHFFWSESILWRHDIAGRPVTVSLASRDLIVDTDAVGRYLAEEGDGKPTTEEWKYRELKGEGLDILWYDDLDHAQVFDSKANRENLIQVIRQYSLMGRR